MKKVSSEEKIKQLARDFQLETGKNPRTNFNPFFLWLAQKIIDQQYIITDLSIENSLLKSGDRGNIVDEVLDFRLPKKVENG